MRWSSARPRAGVPPIGSTLVRAGAELRVEPGLDRRPNLFVQPALEPGVADLLEPIALDLALLTDLQELVDVDPSVPGVDRVGDLPDLGQAEDRVLEHALELV